MYQLNHLCHNHHGAVRFLLHVAGRTPIQPAHLDLAQLRSYRANPVKAPDV